MASEDAADEVAVEFFPLFRSYKSGRVERLLGTSVVPPGLDPDTSVLSKDVPLHPDSPLPSARLYLPQTIDDDDEVSETKPKLLPVLVYFHGGGFVIESAASPTYHSYLNALASRARILVVSVEYRRAPEHPVPAAYDDSWAALRWVAARADPWLAERGDLARVFLAGDSAGGNIAHNVAMRVAAEGLGGDEGVRIEGLILAHPWFWGKEPIGEETRDPVRREWTERLWKTVCPGTEGIDDPRINPMAEGEAALERLGKLPCGTVMVAVAEKDMLSERGRAYCEGLKKSGWGGRVELLDTEGEDHVFHLLNPNCDKAKDMMDRLVALFSSS
ncbi:probable carboxylesterase 2 [Ananas comosus]|uniref:Probable carboxylesterase 2 n=1 Tax=Ananas comosus TaxID=4615 RepID=A0A6P5EHA3_ANACO|nr:probable carboxylesterase 2 [Ananas comosus]